MNAQRRSDRPAWTTTRWILAVSCVVLALLGAPRVPAEINQAFGGIGAINNGTLANGDGTGDARIEVSGTDLALVKQARNGSGTVLASNADVIPGQTLYFVLYVDNTTSFPAEDIRITDLLDEAQFSYVTGSLEHASVASGSNDATIWAGTWTGWTDGLGGPDDGGSATDSAGGAELDRITFGAVPGQANDPVTIPALTLRAFRFRVTVD